MNFNQKMEERLIRFEVLIIDIVNKLPDNRVGNHLGGQLLRSGTSPALNYGEALGAGSRKDFIHKLCIILKELRESHNDLKILSQIYLIRSDEPALIESNELVSIFVKSVKTLRKISDVEN